MFESPRNFSADITSAIRHYISFQREHAVALSPLSPSEDISLGQTVLEHFPKQRKRKYPGGLQKPTIPSKHAVHARVYISRYNLRAWAIKSEGHRSQWLACVDTSGETQVRILIQFSLLVYIDESKLISKVSLAVQQCKMRRYSNVLLDELLRQVLRRLLPQIL